MCAGNRAVLIFLGEEVENPPRSFGEAGGETPFSNGEVVECVWGLEVRGGKLGVVKALVNRGKEFKGEFEPGFVREDCVWGVKGGGEGLVGTTKAMEGNAGRMSVGDGVVVKRVGDDDGGGLGVANEISAEVLKREQLRGEAGVGEGELVVQREDVAHGEEGEGDSEEATM